jgi:hypothetical protein
MNSAADDVFSRWCAERPAPREINAWLARCPEPSMFAPVKADHGRDSPTADSHKQLRESVVALEREVAALRHELAAVASNAAENLNAALKQVATETGVLVGEVHADVDRLRKRVADNKR